MTSELPGADSHIRLNRRSTLDQYAGMCSVCGVLARFAYFGGSARESYGCEKCASSMRERGQAQALLELYGNGQTCLRDLCGNSGFASLAIYEPGVAGPFRTYMGDLRHYQQSCYQEGFLGGELVDGVVNQDLQQLTFDSGSFDLVVTSDILEHVRKPWLAFAEIKRVLKPGGRHVFTVPLQYPMPPKTMYRVDVSTGEDRHLVPPVYHGNGSGGRSLVYTDFGKDMLDNLAKLDMKTSISFVDSTNSNRRKVVIFTSRKSFS